MPILPHWTKIAEELGIGHEEFCGLALKNDEYFKPTVRKYVKGKKRELDRPRRPHKRFLRLANKALNRLFPVHGNAQCGVPNKSRFKAINKHVGRKAYVTRDFSNCYPNVKRLDLRIELEKNYCDAETAELLSYLLTVRGRIAQGSPVSAFALNIYLYRLDDYITTKVAYAGGRFTRYGDDLIVSLMNINAVKDVEGILNNATGLYSNLEFNQKKLAEKGLQLSDKEIILLGLDVRSSKGPRIPTATQLRAQFKVLRYIRSAQSVDWDSIENIARIRRSLMGTICDFRQAHDSNARHLEMLLSQGDRIVSAKLFHLGLCSRKNKWWSKRKRKNEAKHLSQSWKKTIECSLKLAA